MADKKFLTEERHGSICEKQLSTTPQTLATLRALGVSGDAQLKLEYFFYSNALAKGQSLATRLEQMGYSANCDAAAHDPSLFVVTGWTTPVPMDEKPLLTWTQAMCDVGYEHDCEFDGWGTHAPAQPVSRVRPANVDRTAAAGGPILRYEKFAPKEALAALDRYRLEFGKSKIFPFLIGDEDDKSRFEEMIDPPADGGRAFLEEAKRVDAAAWLARSEEADDDWPDGDWPRDLPDPTTAIQSLYNLLTGQLKPEIYLALVRIEDSWQVFAPLGYGGWNECPEPHVHVAIHQHWAARHASSPIAISGDVVECHATRPSNDPASALALAREQYVYCPDIVDQGTETIANLGASLVKSPRWYFWWD